MKEPTTITLEDPVEKKSGEQVTELTLRPPTMRDVRMALDGAKGDVAQSIELVTLLSGQPRVIVEGMTPQDFAKASDAVADFLGALGLLSSDSEG